MNRPSTRTIRQKVDLQGQQLTIGLDLGDRSSSYSVLNGVAR